MVVRRRLDRGLREVSRGRLVKLGLGTYKNTDGWPQVPSSPPVMGRVEALLGVSEELPAR